MNSIGKKSPGARGIPQPFNRPPVVSLQLKPGVAQLRNGLSAMSIKRPVAPPVYRPQATPKAAQPKMASGAPSRKTPVAPPAYRPQPIPKVLQTKNSLIQNPQAGQARRHPVAPPVYRPEAKIVQPKAILPQRKSPTAPPVYRPAQGRIAQPKMAAAAPAQTLPKNPVYRPQAARPKAMTRSVLQLLEKEAADFIKDREIKWTGKISRKTVAAYAKNEGIDAHLRQGLVDAWNVGANKGQFVNFVSDEVREGGRSSHVAKVERETRNKLQGDMLLKQALDFYQTKRLKGPCSIEGFRLCRYKRGIAVAISRSTGTVESKAMKKEFAIQRQEHKDPYKWFSESAAHTEKFLNNSEADTGARLVVWVDGDVYLEIRCSLQHEFLSSGVEDNRFHQENVSGHLHLINIGIHGKVESQFNRAIVSVSDLEGGEKIETITTVHVGSSSSSNDDSNDESSEEQLTPEDEAERRYQAFAAELGEYRS